MRSVFRTAPLLGLTMLALAPSQPDAQTARSSGGASAQTMQQLQQLAAERTALQADNAKLQKDLEALRAELDGLRGGQAKQLRAAQAEAARTATARDAANRDLEQQRERMQDLVQKSREIIDTLRGVETDRNALQQKLTVADSALKVCAERNNEFYKINGELLERLERRGGRGEPFTQLTRVRLENLIDEYRYRAEEQKVDAPAAAAP